MSGEEHSGERLYASTFEEALAASPDHAERYRFAARYADGSGPVFDAACGTGYGAWYLSEHTQAPFILAADLSEHALLWAQTHFGSPAINYMQFDFSKEFGHLTGTNQYQLITCFETVEHMQEDGLFIQRLCSLLRQGGKLIISAPNEDVVPHLNNYAYHGGVNPYHFRHYRPYELERLVRRNGFQVAERYTQLPDGKAIPGEGGPVSLLVCVK